MRAWSEIKKRVFTWLENKLLPDGATVGQVPVKQQDGTWSGAAVGGLPSMSGNGGKWLTTDGTSASWAANTGWEIGGNTTNQIGKIGTLNDYDFQFIRNNAVKQSIQKDNLTYYTKRVTFDNAFYYDQNSGSPLIRLITGSFGLTFKDLYGTASLIVAPVGGDVTCLAALNIKKLKLSGNGANVVTVEQLNNVEAYHLSPFFDIKAGGILAPTATYKYNTLRIYVNPASDSTIGNITLGHNGGRVGVGLAQPLPSAQLHVASTTKGSLPAPQMSATQAETIASPADGLLVFVNDITTPGSTINARGYWWYDQSNSQWTKL